MEESAAGDLLFRAGDYLKAMDRFAAAVHAQPRVAEYHYKFSCAAWKAEALDQVEPHLLQAAFLEPQHPAVREALALWFMQTGNVEAAKEHSATACALEPGNVEYLITHADVLAAAGDSQSAWNLIQPHLARGVSSVWLARIYARIAPAIGHESKAAAFVNHSLRTLRLTPDDCARLQFSLAQLLDRLGRYDQAFNMARLANESSCRTFDPAAFSSDVYARIGYYSRRRMKSLPRATHGDRRPLFIVGMPRSGTSLVEQILASHPQVHGAGELPTLSQVIRDASAATWSEGNPFPDYYDFLSLAGPMNWPRNISQ